MAPRAFSQMTPDEEDQAFAFAQTHHPELANLLLRLKSENPTEYKNGVTQLHKEFDRLQKTKEKNPDRYETAVKYWTYDSRIRLLAARYDMSKDPGTLQELGELIKQRQQLKIDSLTLERDRLKKRLEKLDGQLADEEKKSPNIVKQALDDLKSKAPRPGNTKPKPVTKSPKNPADTATSVPATTKPATPR